MYKYLLVKHNKWIILTLIIAISLIMVSPENSNANDILKDENKNIDKNGRIALVIGNSDYKELSPLKNPSLDAEAIAKRLKKFGFTLIHPIQKSDVQYNLNRRELLVARDALSTAAKGKRIAFIYYSGHGASLGQHLEAHILPVDIKKPTGDAISLELLEKDSLNVNKLLQHLNQISELTIAVFDACREIPQLSATKGMSNNDSWKGLSRISSVGTNRIIAYSGSQGQVVADGVEKYSPYTRELLDVLDNHSYLEIGDLFRKVAMQTKRYTNQIADLSIQGVDLDTYYLQQKVDVAELQQKLKASGYYNGKISGVYDNATESALARFAQDQKN